MQPGAGAVLFLLFLVVAHVAVAIGAAAVALAHEPQRGLIAEPRNWGRQQPIRSWLRLRTARGVCLLRVCARGLQQVCLLFGHATDPGSGPAPERAEWQL